MDNVAVNKMVPGIKWQQPQTDAFLMWDLVPHFDYSSNWSWSFSFLLIKSATGWDSTEEKKIFTSERLLSPYPTIFIILFNSCPHIRLRIEKWARFFIRPVPIETVACKSCKRNLCISSVDNYPSQQRRFVEMSHGKFHNSFQYSKWSNFIEKYICKSEFD